MRLIQSCLEHCVCLGISSVSEPSSLFPSSFQKKKKRKASVLSFFFPFSFALLSKLFIAVAHLLAGHWVIVNHLLYFLCFTMHIVIIEALAFYLLLTLTVVIVPLTDCAAFRQLRLGEREGKAGEHRLEIQTWGSLMPLKTATAGNKYMLIKYLPIF